MKKKFCEECDCEWDQDDDECPECGCEDFEEEDVEETH